jgi:hypothetical protein
MADQSIDPLDLAAMSDDQLRQISNSAGYDQAQLTQQRNAAQSALGIGDRVSAAASDLVTGAGKAGDTIVSAANKTIPYAGALLGGVAGGLPGAYLGYKAAGGGGEEASNAPTGTGADTDEQARLARVAAGKAIQPPTAQAPTAPPQAPYQPIPMPGGFREATAAVQQKGAADQRMLEAQQLKQADIEKKAAEDQYAYNAKTAQDELDKANWQNDFQGHKNQAEAAQNDAASLKVDPTRFYENEDGTTNYGKSIGAALAVGLGALGTAMTHGNVPNTALAIINKAIDDDQAAQRGQIASKQEFAKQKVAGLSTEWQQHQDLVSSQRLDRIQMLQDAANNVTAMQAHTTDKEAQARGDQLKAALAGQIADLKQQHGVEGANFAFKNRELKLQEDRMAAVNAHMAQPKTDPKQRAALVNVWAARQALARVRQINAETSADWLPNGAAKRERGDMAQRELSALLTVAKNRGGISTRNAEIFSQMAGAYNPASMGIQGAREAHYAELDGALQNEEAAIMAGGGAAAAASSKESGVGEEQ